MPLCATSGPQVKYRGLRLIPALSGRSVVQDVISPGTWVSPFGATPPWRPPVEDVLDVYAADTPHAHPEEDTAALTEPTIWALFEPRSHPICGARTDAEVPQCAGGNRVRYLFESDVPGEHITAELLAKRC